MQIDSFNEVRNTVIGMYIEIKQQYDETQARSPDMNPPKPTDYYSLDVLKMLDDDEENEKRPYPQKIFQLKLVAIHDKWRQNQSKQEAAGAAQDKKEGKKEAKKDESEAAGSEINAKEAEAEVSADDKSQISDNKRKKKGKMTKKDLLMQELLLKKKHVDDKNKNMSKDEEDEMLIKEIGVIDQMIQQQAGDEDSGDQKSENQEDEEDQVQEDGGADDFVEQVLEQFLINSESPFLDDINIILMLRALPSKIVDYNLDQMTKFNFAIVQNSLIAYQNKDQVTAFDYFDEKNKSRVQNIRTCILE